MVYEAIRSGILDGTWRAGRPLPKVDHFVNIHHVSNKTVVAALARLIGEGLAHVVGKQWIVGPGRGTVATGSGSSTSPAVVLILQHKEHAWRSLGAAERTSRFTSTFIDEAERYGVEIVPVFTSPNEVADVFAAGPDGIRRLADSLGERYRGILIPCSTEEFPELREFASTMCRFRRPVVWFDRTDEAGSRDMELAPGVYRCHFDEREGVRVMLTALHEMGHRVIGVPNVHTRFDDWVEHRIGLMVDEARRLGLPFRIIPAVKGPGKYPPGSPASQLASWRTRSQRANRVVQSLPDRAIESAFGQRLVYLTSILMPFVADPELTAIVAPHDEQAKGFYYWLRAAGIDMPGELSLLSFDNHLSLHPAPVASLDFGFGSLGYSAFHVLMRDIPVRCRRNGDVAPSCRLVYRSTLGRARATEAG